MSKSSHDRYGVVYRRFGYGKSLAEFSSDGSSLAIGELTRASVFNVDRAQVAAWEESVECLRDALGKL